MQKFLTKAIVVIGIICLVVPMISNLIFHVDLDYDISERTKISIENPLNFLLSTVIAVGILACAHFLNNISIKKKWILITIVATLSICYIAVQVTWINYRDAHPGHDSNSVYTAAKDIYEGNTDNLLHSVYLEKYPHQIPLAYMESFIFRIFGSTNYKIMQYINAVCNLALIFGLYLITKEISKKYKVNKVLPLILSIAFVPLIMLSTFVYGDIIGMAFSIFSIYFVIKYNNDKKIRYLIFSTLAMSIAYMARMNSLIFIVGIALSLLFELIREKNNLKTNAIKMLLILGFVLISIFPAKLITAIGQNTYDLKKENSISTLAYLYMGMTEGCRQNGWYNDYGAWGWDYAPDEANRMYKEAIGERVQFLITHPLSLFKFYAKKNISMWAENTYGSVYYNGSFNFAEKEENYEEKDMQVGSMQDSVEIYQKACILIIFICSILVLIQNRKNLSFEIILLLMIFMGGLVFHNLWEAKSRYIIPYIIVLIPVVGIKLSKIFNKKKLTSEEISDEEIKE